MLTFRDIQSILNAYNQRSAQKSYSLSKWIHFEKL